MQIDLTDLIEGIKHFRKLYRSWSEEYDRKQEAIKQLEIHLKQAEEQRKKKKEEEEERRDLERYLTRAWNTIGWDRWSDSELKALSERLTKIQKEVERIQTKKKENGIAQVKHVMNHFGVKLSDLEEKRIVDSAGV